MPHRISHPRRSPSGRPGSQAKSAPRSDASRRGSTPESRWACPGGFDPPPAIDLLPTRQRETHRRLSSGHPGLVMRHLPTGALVALVPGDWTTPENGSHEESRGEPPTRRVGDPDDEIDCVSGCGSRTGQGARACGRRRERLVRGGIRLASSPCWRRRRARGPFLRARASANWLRDPW